MGVFPGPYVEKHRWMLFVDGENFTIRAQELAERQKITLVEGPYFKRDMFAWVPGHTGLAPLAARGEMGCFHAAAESI